jgi:hypothetical protein
MAVVSRTALAHNNVANQPAPSVRRISRKMRNFFYAVAAQGTVQVLTIIIMVRFVSET